MDQFLLVWTPELSLSLHSLLWAPWVSSGLEASSRLGLHLALIRPTLHHLVLILLSRGSGVREALVHEWSIEGRLILSLPPLSFQRPQPQGQPLALTPEALDSCPLSFLTGLCLPGILF